MFSVVISIPYKKYIPIYIYAYVSAISRSMSKPGGRGGL